MITQIYNILEKDAVLAVVSIRRDTNENAVADLIEYCEAHITTPAENKQIVQYGAEPITADDSPGWALFMLRAYAADGRLVRLLGAQPATVN